MATIRARIEKNLPDFVEIAKSLFNDDYDVFMNAYDREYKRSITINTSKISREFLAGEKLSTKHPYYAMGLYYYQEKSASLPVHYFDFDRDVRVLDMCAAPGGKTLQLALKLSEKGILYSNDISVSRQRATVKNIEKFGLSNCIVMAEHPKKLTSKFRHFFDVILVDAPCSGEGMFAKDSSVMKSWSLDKVKEYSHTQRELLSYAADLLAPSGKIMYSTCTFNCFENEEVVDSFLTSHRNFRVENITSTLEKGIGSFRDDVIIASNRVLPHKIDALGHYFIVLKNTDDKLSREHRHHANDAPRYYVDFASSIGLDVKRAHYVERSGKLYAMNDGMEQVDGFRVLRSGLYLGDYEKGRFKPSQAFAMTLNREDVSSRIDYSLNDSQTRMYLSGQTIVEKREKGYYVVFVDGMPAGFVMSDGSKLKNKRKKDWIVV